ncbi:5-hydroxytryptamine receptor-like [Lycorma delicatula]|uniref:5-hydroxytryptamine receptor-like n=1 Tax=Lycorma delicatula TaxID=130591 RepID=UPI003F518B85
MEELSRILSKREARRPLKWPWKRKLFNTTTTTATITTGISKLTPITSPTTTYPSITTTPSTTTTTSESPILIRTSTISKSSSSRLNDINDYVETNEIWWNQMGDSLWEEKDVTTNLSTSISSLPTSWNVTSWNSDKNFTSGNEIKEQEGSTEFLAMIITAFILGLIILATVIGNVFVIAAILLERNLQSVANYLILSLAVADLLVACLVMPLGAVYQVSQEWTLGPELCDMWTSSDVLCCTASILHLVAIALDRYWAVTNIDYIHQRTGKRIGLMILIIWCVSFLVCIAPLLGWKDPGWEKRVSQDRMCLVSQDIGYQIFATASSFYLPLMVILFLYWRIFQAARKRIRRRVTVAAGTSASGGTSRTAPPGGVMAGLCAAGAAGGSGGIAAAVVGVIGRPLPTISEATTTTTTTAFTNVSSTNTSPEKASFGNGLEPDPPTCDLSSQIQVTHYHPPKRKNKEAADTKRERKAAKTLAIITGAFVVCWLPFFIMAVLLPGDSGMFHQYVIAFFLWLGYFNSTLNPIIYTIFSPEFRHAFKRILCGRRASIRRRNVRYLH